MLLLTVNEWIGPSIKARDEQGKTGTNLERVVGFVTNFPLAEAIDVLREYEEVYQKKYEWTAVNYRLLSVSTIEDLSADSISKARINCIESDTVPTIARFKKEIVERQSEAVQCS